ncbi:MAG: tetratricopeptide repeat protein [Bacteroidales bacterium]|jgi:tetratricopeptide (TPR) repeat protein|nr:tetratricopeptide repeat protein [Bacteroidales bacterium]
MKNNNQTREQLVMQYFWEGQDAFLCGQYEKAIECFQKIIGLDPIYDFLYEPIGCAYIELGKVEPAVDALKTGRMTLLDIFNMSSYNFGNAKYKKKFIKVLNKLLDVPKYDKFFESIVLKDNKEGYKDIYIQSLLIMSKLHVENNETLSKLEKSVAHNTTVKTARNLLFKDSEFRLSDTDNLNDPSEGLSLLKALKIKEKDYPKVDKDNAFVASFSFNLENLTMLRLYGKDESKKEATGVSIVFNKTFFDANNKGCLSPNNKKSVVENKIITETKSDNKASLYRCVYIDPDNGFVESISHKDKYALKREKAKDGDIEQYEAAIKDLTCDIKEGLKELERKIKKLDKEIVAKLLLQLRYLIKDVAFKDEQECRIIQVADITDKEKVNVDEAKNTLFLNYIKVEDYVEELIFAPNVDKRDINNFEKRFIHEGKRKIECRLSKLPYYSV